jgi:hypothetical protein
MHALTVETGDFLSHKEDRALLHCALKNKGRIMKLKAMTGISLPVRAQKQTQKKLPRK